MAKLKLVKANNKCRISRGFSKQSQDRGYHLIVITGAQQTNTNWQGGAAKQHAVHHSLL